MKEVSAWDNRRQGARFGSVVGAVRGWHRKGWMLILLWLCIQSGPPLWAQGLCQAADAEVQISEAIRKAQEYFTLNTPLERALLALEQAQGCPDADLSFDLALIEGLVRLSFGEVREARTAWDRALSNADAEGDRLLIRRLQKHVEGQYLQVTFVSREGEAIPVSIQIQGFQPDALEGEQGLGDALGEDLEDMAKGFHRRMIAGARQGLTVGNKVPLEVWLPKGTYKLSSGQTLLVQGEKNQLFTVEKVRFPERTLLLTTPGILYRPLDSTRVQSARLGTGGLSVQGVYGLSSGMLLSGLVGVLPVTLWDPTCGLDNVLNGLCVAGNSDVAEDGNKRVRPAVLVGVGGARPVYPHPSFPLLLGVGVRATWFGDGFAYPDSNGTNGGPGYASVSTLCVGVHPSAELLYRFDLKGQPLALNLGTSLGIGPMIPLPSSEWPEEVVITSPYFWYSRLLFQGELHVGVSLLFWGGKQRS